MNDSRVIPAKLMGKKSTGGQIQILERPNTNRYLVNFNCNGSLPGILERIGEAPLPPYIKQKLNDKNRYQTVYSREKDSIAAPTAGLHFTDELLEKIPMSRPTRFVPDILKNNELRASI